MKNPLLATFMIAFGLSAHPNMMVRADTVYFENGGSIEGIVEGETRDSVKIDIGFGTITCARNQIKNIDRSTDEELRAINEKWEKKREELKEKEAEFRQLREQRFKAYEEWAREERERRLRETREAEEIQVARDVESKHILVEVLLNDKIKAMLVLDTGASIVVLSKRVGQELGVDFTDVKKDVVTLQLAGNRKIDARMVLLKSIRVQDVEVKDVVSAVLLEDIVDPGFKDGLLGMSFLNKFNLKIDLKNMKIVLEKI